MLHRLPAAFCAVLTVAFLGSAHAETGIRRALHRAVDDLRTGHSIVCPVLDRGPYVSRRIVDLSCGAADALGIRARGMARVRMERMR